MASRLRGARSILVTHYWSVESESARQRAGTAFARYATTPKLPRAEAQHATQLKQIRGAATGYSLAHPQFWAPPYALIGDGGR